MKTRTDGLERVRGEEGKEKRGTSIDETGGKGESIAGSRVKDS